MDFILIHSISHLVATGVPQIQDVPHTFIWAGARGGWSWVQVFHSMKVLPLEFRCEEVWRCLVFHALGEASALQDAGKNLLRLMLRAGEAEQHGVCMSRWSFSSGTHSCPCQG